jgi:hypothetical protein
MKLDVDKIKKLSEEGFGSTEISKHIGGHPASISKVLKRLGSQKRPPCLIDRTSLDKRYSEINLERLRFAAEHFAKFYFSMLYIGCSSPGPEASYDLVIDNKDFLKVQVKTSIYRSDSGSFKFTLSRTRNNSVSSRKIKYEKSECDLFFLLDAELNAWLIPFDKLKGKGAVSPSLTFPGYQVVFNGMLKSLQ